ncbi:tail terminator [Arthrobacter phage Persistence]|uniref:Tail terminator n=1 Tax=Arthrobacter phage Persistence TaxID=2836007 RepID=A0A8F3IKS2_9CAUD|nr:tail terminator [Arthrobacter phage Persistence]QWY79642.1 tail terminator [Arthrobacter phage Persistence]
MTGDALATAFESLLTGFTVYKDKVPGTPSFPYVFVLTNFPSVTERAKSRDVQARQLRSRTTVVGLTAASVRIIAQKVSDRLEGQRLTVDGWNLGRIESEPNDQLILPDNDVVVNGQNPLYQPFDWKLTGSRI